MLIRIKQIINIILFIKNHGQQEIKLDKVPVEMHLNLRPSPSRASQSQL